MFKKVFQSIFPKKLKEEDITPYLLIGESKGIDKLVDRFYFYMDTLCEAQRCRELHPESLEPAKKKLKMFLSGWFGGPSLYIEKYGHPRMRARHLPFKISSVERDEWLLCMRKAMDDLKLNKEFDGYLWKSFENFAEHMRNQES
ncbi:group II truncated hemoglobin [Halobacteriovorax marinus]|uniref:group II truncated hemoglobin n=1 Tax=Halobacteriovorax marinus TaxID=97084 RepID=UPI003A8CD793